MMREYYMLFAFLLLLLCFANHAKGQDETNGKWWPHPEWGVGDEAGSSNRISTITVMRAMSMIKEGKISELSFVHEPEMPVALGRTFKVISPSFPTGGPAGLNNIVWNDDYFSGELGHAGTQFDAPSHIGKRIILPNGKTEDRYYNGFTGDDLKSPYGVLKLGVEKVKPIVTRCYLIDIAKSKNVNTLGDGYEVTLKDVKEAMRKQSIAPEDIQEGDAVFFNYGWWRYWPDKEKVLAPRPGINKEVAEWLVSKKISLVGSDNSTDQGGTHAVHFDMLVKHGIVNLEFMNFEEILRSEVDRFALFFTPIRLKGATGSPARPIAIY
ncbi:cyclase family protein [Reichenbachiella sp.]|uniref:cyclase family protein n=1 Tax=Reichenbachiella sp. TaxID=2184521 RepID=UPI003BB0DF53